MRHHDTPRQIFTATGSVRELQGGPRMQLEITLDQSDIERLLRAVTPVRIRLGDGVADWIQLEPPKTVALVPDRGVRIETAGSFRASLGVIDVPVLLEKVTFVLRPVVDDAAGSPELKFGIEIEDGDLFRIPALVDRGIQAVVNRQLRPPATPLSWPFALTLGGQWDLPNRILPPQRFCLGVARGEVSVTHAGVSFRVEFDGSLERDHARPEDALA